jgi:DNA-binding response OmpR family regulator
MADTYTILVVEDDKKLRLTVEDYLTMNSFSVITAADGEEALQLFEKNKDIIDLILLDGLLPKLDGFDVLKKIREQSSVPVIMISARESEREQLAGFRLGADNYITKPFLLSVLKEHINVLISRTTVENSIIEKGAVKLDTRQRRVFVNDKEIDTTPKEYEVLLYFLQNEKIVLDRDAILDHVWGRDYFGDFRTVDTIVKQLRKKLTDEYPYIKSVYGVGYYFEV